MMLPFSTISKIIYKLFECDFNSLKAKEKIFLARKNS